SPSPDRRLRVMLLFGGQSAEHDVSRVSAVAVARALDPVRYDVVPVAISREGRWLLADRARAALETGRFPDAFDVDGAPVRLAEGRSVALREDGVTKAELDRCEDTLGYRCVVKPANLGSSVGVSKAADRAALEGAVDVALRFDEWILVEEAIAGREIEVAVLG